MKLKYICFSVLFFFSFESFLAAQTHPFDTTRDTHAIHPVQVLPQERGINGPSSEPAGGGEVGVGGQAKIKVSDLLDSFEYNNMFFHYLRIQSKEELDFLPSIRFSKSDYPFVMIRENTANGLEKILIQFDKHYKTYGQFKQYTEEIENLYDLQIKHLNEVESYQKQRVDNYKTLADSLYGDTKKMNELLDLSVKTAETAIKGRQRRTIVGIILGALAGFALGTVVAN